MVNGPSSTAWWLGHTYLKAYILLNKRSDDDDDDAYNDDDKNGDNDGGNDDSDGACFRSACKQGALDWTLTNKFLQDTLTLPADPSSPLCHLPFSVPLLFPTDSGQPRCPWRQKVTEFNLVRWFMNRRSGEKLALPIKAAVWTVYPYMSGLVLYIKTIFWVLNDLHFFW